MLAFHIYAVAMSLITIYTIYTIFRDDFRDRKWYERLLIAGIAS